MRRAAKDGKALVVRAVTTVHGASDHAEKSTLYEADLLAWQADDEREVTGPDTIAITLSAAPRADDRHLRYAFTGTRGARSGPTTGARGNLRDSDPTRSGSGDPPFNGCVHFDVAVP